ncbi:HAD family phosphatase [Sulfitobacter noctilucicola]|uniref:FkbH-like protein n=1 Tax=Sulfitobacter noctilucicola TaxID=1342301 RepID=A0A7W6Q4E3_9RHOB|nr:HAD-IIIC family phosphatase [Sulfitobacter noctilucicola]KIN62870.1 HAD family phosphatase [Sulfitobacter noctilucicola]MBB4172600.1 FkbH-like protein [Sulfitobacter noctilucicola]
MGLALDHSRTPLFSEDIRLIIWDLDETFWDGTITEEGMTYRQDHHDLVIDLAKRGIMSSICSKNDHNRIESTLRESGLWDYFIFPSIDWTPKGPRIQSMLTQVGLRAGSVLFVDDNNMNLAQAAHMNPGLNVSLPTVIPELGSAPQMLGKADPKLTRLAQYKLNERKTADVVRGGGDTVTFLRHSNVRAFIEYDVESHLDRAIELINRTNQLNFTKKRLPEDMAAARADLLAVLSHNTTDAALIRVRDDYGDYGFVGFYLTRRIGNKRHVEHFCFSCRTLNMFVEHWVYGILGRPLLTSVGEVLTDPTATEIDVDWITPVFASDMATEEPPSLALFDRIYARGGCDLASLLHYFSLHTKHVTEELNLPKNGQMFRRDHTSFLVPALEDGLTEPQLEAARLLGYEPQDFETEMMVCSRDKTLFLLSFWADADIPVYRHETGLEVPYWLVGAQNHNLIAREELRSAVAETDVQRERLDSLCSAFRHQGLLSDDEMRRRYTLILDRLPADAAVIIVLANERGPVHYQDPSKPNHPHHKRLNEVVKSAAGTRKNVILLDPMQHIQSASDLIDLNHFKRPVYHRMYNDALTQLTTLQGEEIANG